jgi:preprotein translocase subunit SecG
VYSIVVVVHVIICLGLMLVVLMQSSKGEGLAGAFGGGGISGAVFGGRGAATFLSRATTVLAICFMFSCIGLTLLSRGAVSTTEGGATNSAVQRLAGQQQQQQQQQMPVTTTPTQQAPIQTTTSGQQTPTPPSTNGGK